MTEGTASDLVYLRADTKIEPLASRWYVWPHLLSPVTRAYNMAYRYLPMLRSFTANPAVHLAAAANPEFFCAPFMQLEEGEIPGVRSLLQATMKRCSNQIGFAENLAKLTEQLQQDAIGQNLDEVYRQLPDDLAGLVEIVYDLSNRPQLRIIEGLACTAACLDNREEQEVAFFSAQDEQRHFFLNTPRLNAPGRVFFKLPFDDQRFDLLATARISPISFSALADSLGVESSSRDEFRRFFQLEPPIRSDADYHGDGIRVRYFGHACVLIQVAGLSILIDPTMPSEQLPPQQRFTFGELPDFIDYVFLTHNHQDHFVPEIFLQLRKRIGRILVPGNNQSCIADPSLKLALRSLGFDNVDVLNALDSVQIPHGSLTSLPFYGEHAGLDIHSKHGLSVSIKGKHLLFLADADCVDRALYRRLAARLGKVDVLFIGMECHGAPLTWIYGPYLTHPPSRKDDESRRLSGSDCEKAWAIVEEFSCANVFVYAMGQEPWLKHLLGLQYTPDSKQIVESNKFVQQCMDVGIPASRLYGCHEFVL